MHSNFFNNRKTTYLIAEIGVNHNGSIKIAKKLIKTAKKLAWMQLSFNLLKQKNYLKKNSINCVPKKKSFKKNKSF